MTLAVGPLLAGIGLWAAGDARRRLVAWAGPAAMAATTALAVAAVATRPSTTLDWGGRLGLRLEVDHLAGAPLVLAPFVALAVVVYATGYGEARGRSRMVGLLVAFVGAMELLLLAGDLLTLLVGWELVGLVSWALIGHHWRGDAPRRANEAFVATRLGDLGLFLAAGALFAATGSLRLDALTPGAVEPGLAGVVVAGVLLAAAAKSAQLPFSPWLFSAMAGPTPASALLHSATMVAAGAYLLARLQPFLDLTGWFGPLTVAVGLATAVVGSVVASTHSEVKRLLAGSTAAHHGFMVTAVGAGYPAVAIAHLVAHGLFKALLFVAAGRAIDEAGTERLDAMALGRALPLTAGLAAVGAAALAAVPPLGGARTKELVTAAATHAHPLVGVAVLGAGALSAFYATRFLVGTYGLPAWLGHARVSGGAPPGLETSGHGSSGDGSSGHGSSGHGSSGPGDGAAPGRRRSWTRTQTALALLAVPSLALGVLWVPGAEDRWLDVTGGTLPASAPWELVASVVLVALSAYGAVVLARRGRAVTTSPVARTAAGWLGLPRAAEVVVVRPTLAAARGLAHLDDRVVDGGVRGAAAAGRWLAGRAARADDVVVDAGVRGTARLGTWLARSFDRVTEVGLDGALGALAGLVGAAGRDGRRLQGGQAHRYYAGVAVGVLVAAVVAGALR